MFSLYALLGEGAAPVSPESLAAQFQALFGNEKGFAVKYAQLPFAKHKAVMLSWGNWATQISYEEGKKVVDDSAEISRILGSSAPPKLASIDKRIRAVFDDDNAREFTDQTIHVMEFLRAIKGAIVFDPQQKDILQPPGQTDRKPADQHH